MAFAFVQGNGAGTGGAINTISVTLTSAVGVGNAVYGMVSWGSSSLTAITSVTDDKSNTYTVKDQVADTSNVQSAAFFILGNITNGPKTITVNFGSSLNFLQLQVCEYSGVIAAADPTEGHSVSAVQTAKTTDGLTSGSITTTNIDLIVGGTFNTNSTTAAVAGTGFTRDNTSSSQLGGSIEHLAQVSAGSAQATFTLTSTNRSITEMMALKPAVATDTLAAQIWL